MSQRLGSFLDPNLLDYVVTFDALKKKDIHAITYIELNNLKKREGFEKKGIRLDFSEEVVEHLAAVGFDKRYGARPLQRAIENEVGSPLAKWLLEHPTVETPILYVNYNATKGLEIKQ